MAIDDDGSGGGGGGGFKQGVRGGSSKSKDKHRIKRKGSYKINDFEHSYAN
jgi:hypothetical protein